MRLIGEGRVLIKAPVTKDDVSIGGIVLSNNKVIESFTGEVVQSNYAEVDVGSVVCYKKLRGDTQKVDGVDYVILEAEDILLVTE